jgi:hypothetical protein
VCRVDQRRMGGMRGLVERPCCFDVSVERDRDDVDAGRRQLLVQRLPPGQVEAAASPRRPGDEHDLAAAQARQIERVAVEVLEDQIWHARALEDTTVAGSRPERPEAVCSVVRDGHAQTLGDHGDLDAAGARTRLPGTRLRA